MQIEVKVPDALGAPGLTADEILAACVAVNATAVELAGPTIEAFLGKPTVPTWWLEMPENTFETGVLPLEEEMLQDEVELARSTVAARIREWRIALSLAPLASLRARYASAGVKIAVVAWGDLSRVSDAEVDYCFAVATAVGADAISTPLVSGEPRRLAPFAGRHAMRVGFHGDSTTRAADFDAALALSPLYQRHVYVGAVEGCTVKITV